MAATARIVIALVVGVIPGDQRALYMMLLSAGAFYLFYDQWRSAE